MKNILVLSNAYPKPFNPTMGSYVFDQIEAIVNEGNYVTVVSANPYVPKIFSGIKLKKQLSDYAMLGDMYKYGSCDVLAPKCFVYGRIFRKYPEIEYSLYHYGTYKVARKYLKENPVNVIYAVGSILEGRLAQQLSKEFNIPFVVVEHSDTNVNNCYYDEKLKRIYIEVLSCAKDVFFVSKKSEDNFNSKFGKIANTHHIINGYKLEKYTKKSYSNLTGPLNILSVGFLEERKGWLNVLAAVNQLNAILPGMIKFSIVGRGPLENKIKNYISTNQMDEYCDFIGLLPHDVVVEKMAESDLFVLLSRDEPLGIVYLEAMSVGTPIIGSANEGISQIVINNNNGWLVDYGDNEAFIQIIKNILENRDLLSTVGKAGKESALGYTWEANAKKWLGIVFHK